MALTFGEPAGSRVENRSLSIDSTLTGTGDRDNLIAAPLDISLDEFKTMRFIDRARYPKARVMCSGDEALRQSTALGVMRPLPDEAAAGIIRCNVFRPDPVNLSWWTPIVPKVNGAPIKSTSYFFLPDDEGDYHLLFVQAVLPDSVLASTRAQLLDAYGMPKKRGEPGLVTESLWTESWKAAGIWLLLDSRKHSFRRDFTVTYVNPDQIDAAAARGFAKTRNILYYSVHTHYR